MNLDGVNQLKHTTFCSMIYKINFKITVQRLKSIMPHVLSHNQNSFILRRYSCDNILVLQETIHTHSHLYGSKCFMILKLDLKKANDILE